MKELVPRTGRRFQLSLRWLFILVTVLCLGPGTWTYYERQRTRNQQFAIEELQRLRATISFDEQLPVRSGLSKVVLGDNSFGNVAAICLDGPQVTDATLSQLRRFRHLQ